MIGARRQELLRVLFKVMLVSVIAGSFITASTLARASDSSVLADTHDMKQCPAARSDFYGGFWSVPGSNICMSFGGYLWAEGYYSSYTGMPKTNSKSYGIATYGLQLDTYTGTDYGLLRSYMDIRFQHRSVNEWGSPIESGEETQINPWTMYIQFGGFVFGYNQSMFDFYANANVEGTDPATIGDQTNLTMLAHTWELNKGWTATLSLEESGARNSGINPASAYLARTLIATSDFPDIVGAFGQSGDWGRFQISGALHRETAVLANPTQSARGANGTDIGSFWGYALQAGVMFNLPDIASGDTLYLQSAYAEGATSYLGLINASGDFSPPDAFLNSDGSFSKVSGWNATFQYLHNFSRNWNSAIFGGYAEFNLNNPEAEATLGASGGINYNWGGNITWQPTTSLSVTLQYDYNMYKAKNYVNTGKGLPIGAQDASQVLLMAQRMF
ncbi:porin [Castellaniella sp.]|uniref:porin n=1 Tax=Castellaniella sp. TaxID=1955812 RepID=UPI002AFDFE56|nr:porin [Castellaniella sp.]